MLDTSAMVESLIYKITYWITVLTPMSCVYIYSETLG